MNARTMKLSAIFADMNVFNQQGDFMKTFIFIITAPVMFFIVPVLCLFGADLLRVDNGKSNF
jgi:hypothetical protein